MTTIKKKTQITSIDDDMKKLEPLRSVGEIVKWLNCYGRQYGGSSKISK